jgi:hypothetical protein
MVDLDHTVFTGFSFLCAGICFNLFQQISNSLVTLYHLDPFFPTVISKKKFFQHVNSFPSLLFI